MTTLWRDLISIPQQLASDAFVLDLTRGVVDAEATIANYVVTPTLALRFDEALQMVDSAINNRKRRAAFLHGSFGAGKSHFMAVLHLLLSGNATALNIPALAGVVAKHPWLSKRRILLVPAHFIGARDIESKVFSTYVRHVRALHPNASIPPVFLGDETLANADSMRQRIGDDAFFGLLNPASRPDDGWGGFGGQPWNLPRYQAALAAPPNDPERLALISDVVTHIMPALVNVAAYVGRDDNESYVSLQDGLPRLAKHAADLGYDTLVFFLDELILWLMNRAGEHDFVSREAPKIVQFVEGDTGTSPIPIVTFVARQRRFEEFMGETRFMADGQRVHEALTHMGERLITISLEDRDLGPIAQERLLRPVSAEARETIHKAFARLWHPLDTRTRTALLGGIGDEQMFMNLFPFSPAAVECLVGLSSLLQRERTALRLMVHILVDRRETLQLGDVIALGELWDVLQESSEPFSKELRVRFDQARRLWNDRLHPMLAAAHGLDPGAMPTSGKAFDGYRRDALIAKTLLLSALHADGLKVLSNLTVSRLVWLNHGTVSALLPGEEVSFVLQKLRNWSQTVPEITIADTANAGDPGVMLRLTSVDVDQMLESDNGADTHGARVQRVKRELFAKFGSDSANESSFVTEMKWRGATRKFAVSYRNVRHMHDSHFGSPEMPTIFIDYPMDEEADCSPAMDHAHISEFLARQTDGSQAIAWLPFFLSKQGNALLGRLLVAEQWLKHQDARLLEYSPEVRAEARSLIESLKVQGEKTLGEALRVAYRLVEHDDANVARGRSDAHDVFTSLMPGHTALRPDATEFRPALEHLAAQLFRQIYPAAFDLPNETLSKARIGKLVESLQSAFERGETSVLVDDSTLRADLEKWAKPLRLANIESGKNRYQPLQTWREELPRLLGGTVYGRRVADLRAALDPKSKPCGLPTELQDLIIIAWASMTSSMFVMSPEATSPIDVGIGNLPDGLYVQQAQLPTEAEWKEATSRAAAIFGIAQPPARNARTLGALATALGTKLGNSNEVLALDKHIRDAAEGLSINDATLIQSNRFQAAGEARLVILTLQQTLDKALGVVQKLAAVKLTQPLAAIGTSIATASSVTSALHAPSWPILEKYAADAEAPLAAKKVIDEARQALLSYEHAVSATKLRECSDRLAAIIVAASTTATPAAPPPGPTATSSYSAAAATTFAAGTAAAVAATAAAPLAAASAGSAGATAAGAAAHHVLRTAGDVDMLTAHLKRLVEGGAQLRVVVTEE